MGFFLFLIEIHRIKNNLLLSRWLCCHSVWQVRAHGIMPKIITATAKAWAAFPEPGVLGAVDLQMSRNACGLSGSLWACSECRGECRGYLTPLIFVIQTWFKQMIQSLWCLSLSGGNTRMGCTGAGDVLFWLVLFYFGWCSAVYSPSSAAL